MKIGDFFVALGFKFDDKSIKKAEDSFKSFRSNILLTAAAFSGAVYAVEKFVRGSIDQALQFQNLSNQTGIAVEQLQRFESIGRRIGMSSGVASQALGKLTADLTALRLGQGNVAPFQMAGIDTMGKDVFNVLGQLRSKVMNMDNAMATHFITSLGLSPEFINILKLTDKEFTNLSGNAFFSNQKRMLDLRASIEEIKLKFGNLHDEIVSKLAPVLMKLISQFFAWFSKNRGKIVGTLDAIIQGIAKFAEGIARGIGLLSDFINKITNSQNGLKILTGIVAALALSFSPFLLGITALLLILDDVAVWMQGGDSLFGGLYEALAKLGKMLAPIFEKVKEGLKSFIGSLEPMWEQIKKGFKPIAELFEKLTFGPMKDLNLMNLLGGTALLLFLGKILGVFSAIRSVMTGMAVLATIMGGPKGIAMALGAIATVGGALYLAGKSSDTDIAKEGEKIVAQQQKEANELFKSYQQTQSTVNNINFNQNIENGDDINSMTKGAKNAANLIQQTLGLNNKHDVFQQQTNLIY